MTPKRAPAHRAVVYRIDPWSVAKISLPFYICAVATGVLLLVLLWGFLVSTGSVKDFENFVEDTGYRNFEFIPSQMFAGLRSIGLILVVVGTLVNVVTVIVFNLLSSMIGGLQVVTADKPKRRRRRGAAA